MTTKIISNNVPRNLLYWSELTDKEKKEFDWMDNPEFEDFVRYRGWIYATSEFMTTDFQGWDGIFIDTFFSGVLIKYAGDDHSQVIMGLALA